MSALTSYYGLNLITNASIPSSTRVVIGGGGGNPCNEQLMMSSCALVVAWHDDGACVRCWWEELG